MWRKMKSGNDWPEWMSMFSNNFIWKIKEKLKGKIVGKN